MRRHDEKGVDPGAADPSKMSIADNWDNPKHNGSNAAKHDQRYRAQFARLMMFSELVFKHARAIDRQNFIDRKPTDPRRFAPSSLRWSTPL